MMGADFVSNRSEAEAVSGLIDAAVYRDHLLPQQVFKLEWREFVFFDYSYIQDSAALSGLDGLRSNSSIFIAFLDPNLWKIHEYSEERNFGIIKIEAGTDESAINAALFRSPTNNIADAFVYTCHRSFVTTEDEDWVIWGDRGWDIGIAAFSNVAMRDAFCRHAKDWKLMGTEDAVYFMTANAEPPISEAFRVEMMANYRSDFRGQNI